MICDLFYNKGLFPEKHVHLWPDLWKGTTVQTSWKEFVFIQLLYMHIYSVLNYFKMFKMFQQWSFSETGSQSINILQCIYWFFYSFLELTKQKANFVTKLNNICFIFLCWICCRHELMSYLLYNITYTVYLQ